MKIGFLGLGKMGSGIAANLVRAGHEVTVWNRSAQKAQQLVAQGAVLANTPKAAASGRALVVRKYSVSYGRARGSIRDAVHQGSGSHGRSMILHGDGANRDVGSCDKRAADREHPDPAPCADERHCNGESRISESTGDAIRTAGSANPDIRAELCR